MDDLLPRVKDALLGRYAVERHLGAGGMADVFLARDLKHRRQVALKVLRPEVGATIGKERFLQEIEISARLHHPHILPLYDSGEADGLLYYVMPFVEEESLRDRITREGRLSVEESVRLAREIAEALHHAHERDIIHRDVKPDNVLLVAGHAVIADFGIARALAAAADLQLTRAGMSVGTPAYASPEQAFGDAVDRRTDLYGLACVTYEMLAGVPPFQGPTAAAIIAQKTREEPRLPPLPESVPGELEAVLRRALASDRERRQPDLPTFATQLAEALGAAARSAAVPESRPSVAVLPFRNLSLVPDAEFLSDGLSEELIHALTRVQGLRVVARTSAFAYKGRDEDVRQIGEQLGVGHILSGSVRRAGSRLRVTAQLVNARDGLQEWSERYDREVEDVFEIEDEITRAILAQVAPALGGPRAGGSGPTANPRAYELYLRGRHAWATRADDANRRSVSLFEQALEFDPGFDLARAAQAEALVTQGLYGEGSPQETFGRAEAVAREALNRSPGLAEARIALACSLAVYGWRWASAEMAFQEAIAANSGYATGHHWYGINLLAPKGRFPAARMALQQARFLDPLSPAIALSIGLIAYYDGDSAAALGTWDELLASHDRLAVAHYFAGLALVQAGRPEQAVERMERAVALGPDNPESLGGLGFALGAAGRTEAAHRVLDRLAELRRRRYVSPVLDAQVLVSLGGIPEAVDRLREAERLRAADLVWLGVRPSFRPLSGIEAFEALLGRVGVR